MLISISQCGPNRQWIGSQSKPNGRSLGSRFYGFSLLTALSITTIYPHTISDLSQSAFVTKNTKVIQDWLVGIVKGFIETWEDSGSVMCEMPVYDISDCWSLIGMLWVRGEEGLVDLTGLDLWHVKDHLVSSGEVGRDTSPDNHSCQ